MNDPLLTGITVCVHFSALLRLCLGNWRHFDRWIVVTVASDRDTIRLCKEHNIDVVLSQCLRPGKPSFHAAFNKAAIINEGLDSIGLEADGYVCVVDADTLLPVDFRLRFDSWVKAGEVERGGLYGSNGRRVCGAANVFSAYSTHAPWEAAPLERHRSIIGYFNLFHLKGHPNRYPDSNGEEHDDWRFFESFEPHRRRILPFTCLHLGETQMHWGGVIASIRSENLVMGRNLGNNLRNLESLLIERKSKILVCGYWQAEPVREFAEQFCEVGLIDRWAVDEFKAEFAEIDDLNSYREGWTEPISHSLIEADRSFVSWNFWKSMSDNVHLVSSPSVAAAESYDILFIQGDIGLDWLLYELPNWLALLSAPIQICGDLYGFVNAPEWSTCINSILGVPDIIEDSFWLVRWKTLPNNCSFSYPLQPPLLDHPSLVKLRSDEEIAKGEYRKESLCCCLIVLDDDDLVSTAFTMNSLYEGWAGPTLVLQQGVKDSRIQILAARYGINYANVSLNALPITREEDFDKVLELSPEEVIEAVKSYSPWRHNLWLRSGEIVPNVDQSSGASFPEVFRQSLLEAFSHEFPLSLAIPTKVRANTMVIYPLEVSDEPEFLMNWRATRYGKKQRIVILALGHTGARIEVEDRCEDVRVVPIPYTEEYPECSLWADLAEFVCGLALESLAEHLVLIDPFMQPGPGADLFASPQFSNCDFAFPGWAFKRASEEDCELVHRLTESLARKGILVVSKISEEWLVGSVVKFRKFGEPASFFNLFFLRRALDHYEDGFNEYAFELFLSLYVDLTGSRAEIASLRDSGWSA